MAEDSGTVKPIFNFDELLERAKGLWPTRGDLTPRTLREEALLQIFCSLIDTTGYALQVDVEDQLRRLVQKLEERSTERAERDETMAKRVNQAMKVLEPFVLGEAKDIDPGSGFQILVRVYGILKGERT